MTRSPGRWQRLHANEEGFVLIAVLFFVAILMISLTVALPKVKQELQRDREIETMHRGKEYVRAVRLYYRRFGTYPTSIDALVMTNNIRFLRKRYTDPITGKDDWKPILLGQNKAPTAMGPFGEPLDGVGVVTSAGLSGGGTPTPSGGAASSPGDSSTDGTTGSDSNSTSEAGSINTGQTYGPIIGVSPATHNQSILNYKKKNHYNEWEFVYDPRVDRLGFGLQPTAPNPPYAGSPGFGPAPSGGNSGVGNPAPSSPR
jgi:type II secretory pathway pseudopilin PulG